MPNTSDPDMAIWVVIGLLLLSSLDSSGGRIRPAADAQSPARRHVVPADSVVACHPATNVQLERGRMTVAGPQIGQQSDNLDIDKVKSCLL